MKAILGLIITVLMASAAPAAQSGPALFHLWLPGHDWAVQIDIQNFVIRSQEFNPSFDGRKLAAADSSQTLLLTAFLIPAQADLTVTAYRDSAFKSLDRRPLVTEGAKKHDRGDIAFTEYFVTGVKDSTGVAQTIEGISQYNVFAYMVHDGSWLDLHLSTVSKRVEDQRLIDQVLASLRIVDYAPTAADLWLVAGIAYKNSDLPRAISQYEAALALEKETPTLSNDYWKVMVDNLGMAYGISGDLDNAKRVLNYGLSIHPEYPMFHYSLACCYAEEDNLDRVLLCLDKAYEHRANMLKGEDLPDDPSKDDSFKRYAGNDRFMAWLKSLKP